jgi:hypothetical protein
MDRQRLLDRLTQCEEHIARGERHVASQRGLVADLERSGQDAVLAKEYLVSFERLQSASIAAREQIRRELGD